MDIKDTRGYSDAVEKFVKATHSINFNELHKDFLEFIPIKKSQVLDIGSGIGRDAYELYEMGHAVTAVEPLEKFRLIAEESYNLYDIKWLDDSLPRLTALNEFSSQFNFVLSSAVWHHLDDEEQIEGMFRVSELLATNGYFALSLRHGRSGVGSYAKTINIKQIIQCADRKSVV